MLLLVLFSVLFCLLAIVILNNNVMLGIFVTYGTFAFLLLLSGLFGLIVLCDKQIACSRTYPFHTRTAGAGGYSSLGAGVPVPAGVWHLPAGRLAAGYRGRASASDTGKSM